MATHAAEFDRRIRTRLYRDQRLSRRELDLLHTPSLQRLYDLKQLGFSDRVYIDASHTRLAHVVGTMEIALRIVDALVKNLGKQRGSERRLTWQVGLEGKMDATRGALRDAVQMRTGAIRLMALLHDLTHAPFGHTLEDEIKISPDSHDTPARQAEAFHKLLVEYLVWTAHETLVENVFQQFEQVYVIEAWLAGEGDPAPFDEKAIIALGKLLLAQEGTPSRGGKNAPDSIAQLLVDFNFATRALYFLEVSHKYKTPSEEIVPKVSYPVNRILEAILTESPQNEIARHWHEAMLQEGTSGSLHPMRFYPTRDAYHLDIIGDTICADLLDYARRDSLTSGLSLSFDLDRIVEHFTLISYAEPEIEGDHPFRGLCLRAAVDFSHGKFRGDVIGELMGLLQVRYYLYERMLLHPTKCVAGAMLGRAIQLLGFTETPTHWKCSGDAMFLRELLEITDLALNVLSSVTDSNGDVINYFDESALTKALSKLPDLPLNSIRSTRHLLRQRMPTIGKLRARYAGVDAPHLKFANYDYTAYRISATKIQILSCLSVALTTFEAADEQRLDPKTLNRLVEHVLSTHSEGDAAEPTFNSTDASQVLLSLLPTIQGIRNDAGAAKRLLARLNSRRYAKRIFCLMPSSIGSALEVTAEKLADHFTPEVRCAAETAIEDEAKLPRGSVVIHCPPASGPAKTARVLVTYVAPDGITIQGTECGEAGNGRRTARPLCKIATIEGPAGSIFKNHEAHVNSLEGMYKSMWRLWVAVTPPSDIKYKELEPIIGRVMSAAITRGSGRTPISNDLFMVEELEGLYSDQLSQPRVPPVSATNKAFEHRPSEKGPLTAKELEMILFPYLMTLAPSSRRRFNKRAKDTGLIDRILEQRSDPNVCSYFREREIAVSPTTLTWDARNIDRMIERILASIGKNGFRSLHIDEPQIRNLTAEERKAVDEVRSWIWSEVAIGNHINSDGAVKILALAESKGIKLTFRKLLTSGLIADGKDATEIFIDSSAYDNSALDISAKRNEVLLPPELRFTIAHELVHFFIARSRSGALQSSASDERKHDINERICNELAAEMLLPRDLLVPSLVRGGASAKLVRDAALRYGVHPIPLLIRLGGLEEFSSNAIPQAIIFGERGAQGEFMALSGISTLALSTHFPVFRSIGRGQRMPFNDLCENEVSAEKSEVILTGSKDNAESLVKINMCRYKFRESENFRIAVVAVPI